MRQSKHSLITSCVLLGIALLMPAAEAGERGIPEYRQEIQSLTEVPGSASGPAAGLLNPAAWAIQPSGGTYFAHTNWDATHYGGERWDLAAVLSLRAASFGFRRFGIIRPDGEDDAVREYTFGLGGGDLDQAWGLSYSWGGGATEFYPRHKRASIGTILRRSYFSIGAAGTFDLEQEDNYWQADLGIRPFGPRVTLFADATQSYGESADDITFGYGAEVMPIPGFALAVKADRINREDCACSFGETEVSARISFGFGQERLSLRGHLNENGDRLASTYALDSGRFGAPIWHKFAVPFRYPEMTMKGTVAYRRFQFFDNRRTLLGTLKQIERYADDPTVAGLVLKDGHERVHGSFVSHLSQDLGHDQRHLVVFELGDERSHGRGADLDKRPGRRHAQVRGFTVEQIYQRPHRALVANASQGVRSGRTEGLVVAAEESH